MSKQKDKLVDFNMRITEEAKCTIYEMARRRTLDKGKTVSIAQIGRELIDIGLSRSKKKT